MSQRLEGRYSIFDEEGNLVSGFDYDVPLRCNLTEVVIPDSLVKQLEEAKKKPITIYRYNEVTKEMEKVDEIKP